MGSRAVGVLRGKRAVSGQLKDKEIVLVVMTRRRHVSKKLVSESSVLNNDNCPEVFDLFHPEHFADTRFGDRIVAPPLRAVDPAARSTDGFNNLPTATSPERSKWHCKNLCQSRYHDLMTDPQAQDS